MAFLSKLTVTTPPAQPPVPVGLARRHTRIDQVYDDDILEFYIKSATSLIEAFLNRALITQTLTFSLTRTVNLNSWPLAPAPLFILPIGVEWLLMHMQERDIGLPRSPAQSVTSVSTGAWGETDTALVLNTDYNVDLTLDPARIHLISGDSWEFRDHITIRYVAGYGNDHTSIPTPILHALLLLTTHLYEHRGDDANDIPDSVYNMLWPYRLFHFGIS